MKGVRINIDIFPRSWARGVQRIAGEVFVSFGPFRIRLGRI
jgi:hypothetical protein